MPWTPFNSFLARPVEVFFNAASAPAPNSFYLILTNGGTIDATTPMVSVVALEASGNGYARPNYDPAGGSYSNANGRYETPAVTVAYTATTGAIVFDRAVLIGGANSTPGNSTGEVVCFQAQGSTTTIAAGTSYSFLISFNVGGSAANVN